MLDENALQLLLVEDNPADAHLLMMFMKEHGRNASFQWLTNGEDAIAFVRAEAPFESRVPPDGVILDLCLPRYDGYEILSELRSAPSLNDVPVVIFTTSNRIEDLKKVSTFPRVSFISKPMHLDEYETLGKRLIEIEFRRATPFLPSGGALA